MKKNVLIFGLGFQGEKYAKYFLNRNYNIDGVTKSGLNKNNLNGLKNIYKSSDTLKKNLDFFEKFDIIVVAINPYNEQDNILKFLLKIGINNKVIIEKPVSYDIGLLSDLEKNNNYSYFIDEIILNKLYNKIFYKIGNGENIIIKLYDKNKNNYIHILEHIFAGFLLGENFNFILNNNKIIFSKELIYKNDLIYNIILNNKILINYNKGDIKLNNILIKKLFFDESLESILLINNQQNRLLKSNFTELRKFLSKI